MFSRESRTEPKKSVYDSTIQSELFVRKLVKDAVTHQSESTFLKKIKQIQAAGKKTGIDDHADAINWLAQQSVFELRKIAIRALHAFRKTSENVHLERGVYHTIPWVRYLVFLVVDGFAEYNVDIRHLQAVEVGTYNFLGEYFNYSVDIGSSSGEEIIYRYEDKLLTVEELRNDFKTCLENFKSDSYISHFLNRIQSMRDEEMADAEVEGLKNKKS